MPTRARRPEEKGAIEGDIQVEFALVRRIRIDGLRIENALWAKANEGAENIVLVKTNDFRIDLLVLLFGRVVLLELGITGAVT